MADFSITEAVGAGPGLITRQPLAVLAWGALPAIAFAVVLLLFGGMFLGVIAQIVRAGGRPEAAGPIVLQAIGGLMLFVLVAVLAAWVVSAVTTAAVFRAVLQPEQSAFAYLRFGTEELSLMLVGLVLFLVFFGIGIALAIPTEIITLSVSASSPSARVSVTLLMTLLRNVVTIWIWLRLCMATPMTFADRRFHLFDSWTLTRGHTLQLLAVGILAFLIMVVVEVVAGVLGISSFFLFAGSLAAYRSNPEALLSQPQVLLSALGPVLILWAAIYAVVAGAAMAILRAPLAYIYRALTGSDVAGTFS